MIGILSGAGPLAGVDVAKKIIEETIAERDQDHLPLLLFSVPEDIPDRTEFLMGRESKNPGEAIGRLFMKLEAAGATIAAIACNSAHAPAIYDLAKQILHDHGSRMELIHIVEETIAAIAAQFAPQTRIGILSTTGTKAMGLYRLGLEAAGLLALEPDDSLQDTVHQAIYDPVVGIKAQSSPVHQQAIAALENAMDMLVKNGAQAILLGCTEIPLAFSQDTYKGIPIIDPNRIIARRMIGRISPEKLKP